MFGQFQVSDPVYSRELRMTSEDIAIYETQVSASHFDLTYQRGVQIMYSPKWIDVDLGLVNGNGIAPESPDGRFDNNSFKDPFLRLNLKMDPVSFGLYGFYGEDEDSSSKIKNHFYRAGPDIRINQWIIPLDIKAQWLFGTDDNPDFSAAPSRRLNLNGGFVEALWHISKDWKGILLYNRVQVSEKPDLNVHSVTANGTYYLLRNFKIFLEYTTDLEETSPAHPEEADHIEIGFTAAF
jgi:hypothetical protein